MEKLYYTMSEVEEETNLPHTTIRYWLAAMGVPAKGKRYTWTHILWLRTFKTMRNRYGFGMQGCANFVRDGILLEGKVTGKVNDYSFEKGRNYVVTILPLGGEPWKKD